MEPNTEDTNNAAVEATEAAPVRRRTSRRVTASAGTPVAEAPATAEAASEAAVAAEPVAEAAPKKRVTRTRKKVAEPAAEESAEAAAPAVSAPDAVIETPAESAEATAEAAPKKRVTRTRKKVAAAVEEAEVVEAPAVDPAPITETTESTDASDSAEVVAPARRTRGRRTKMEAAEEVKAENTGEAEQAPADEAAAKNESAEAPAEPAAESGRNRNRRGRGQKNETEAAAAETEQSADESDDNKNRQQSQNGNRNGDKNAADNTTRSSRTRQRDRKRRGQGDDFESEITEDDVLLPIAGILDVLDNYAFVRTSGYLPGTSDVYVSLGQVKKYGLRRGDAVVGAIRQPRDGEGGSRQKYNAIVKVDSVNGRAIDEEEKRVDIADLTPIFPQERLRLETSAHSIVGSSIDLVAPIGLGQRGLLVVPAQAQTTSVLTEIAAAVSENKPEAHLMMVLSNAQPEAVTQLQRTVRGEVIAATFDRSAEDHTTIAELAVDRARRLVELGHDVVLLLDSVNRLSRAYAQTQPGAGRVTTESADEYALGQVKRLLSAARNLENGGSLTILATANKHTGNDADKSLLRELRQVVNCEVKFMKTGIGQAPLVDVAASHTLNADAMLGAEETKTLGTVRLALAEADAAAVLIERVRSASSNAALLAEIQRSGRLS